MKQRVVIDTSSLVGAVLRSGSTPGNAFRLALDSFELCISSVTISELRTVLARKHFAKYATEEARLEFLELIRAEARPFEVTSDNLAHVLPPCRDPNDNMFLALAQVAKAAMIVSSDHDLLALNPWNGIPILTPAQFVAQFSTGEASQ